MQAELYDAQWARPEVGEKLSLDQLPAPANSGTMLESTSNAFSRVTWINSEVSSSEKHVVPWRGETKRCFAFVAGNQLDDATRAELKSSRRPDTAINITQQKLAYISGLQRSSPQAVIFQPTVVDDRLQAMLAEYMTQGYEWADRLANGNHARGNCFDDMLTGGMGWTDKYLDTLRDPRGIMRYVHVPWDETLWPECRDDNLSTTRWRAWELYVEKDEAIRRWPKCAGLIIAAAGDVDEDRQYPQQDVTVYTVPYVQSVPIDKSRPSGPDRRGKVKVLQFQWFDDQDGYAFMDPVTKETTWLGVRDFFLYKRRLETLMPGVKLKEDKAHHRVVQVVYLLNRKHELAPPQRLPGDEFTLEPMTGHWDYEKRQWYGFVRLCMDPQRYANSFLRNALEVFAVSAKGGFNAQTDAFRNEQQRQEFVKNAAVPGAVGMVAPEALEKQKIQARTPGEFPAAAMAMLNFCIQSLDTVTGITANSLGAGASDLPGVTMRQGQQVVRVLLAKEFDNLSLFRKQEGRGYMAFLKLIADDRLVRIGGEWSSQVVPLMRKPFTLEYDVWLDDTEHDPNMRSSFTNFLMQAMPMLTKAGLFVPEMFAYLPFPSKILAKMIAQMKAQQQMDQQASAAGVNLKGRGTPVDPRLVQARIQDLQAKAALHSARAQSVGRENQREDFRAVVDAVDVARGHGAEGDRHRLERDKHDLDRETSSAQILTQLLQLLQQGQQANGGEEQAT